MIIIQNYEKYLIVLVNSDVTSIRTLVNLDLKPIRTVANLDPNFQKTLANSDLNFTGSELTRWSRSELTKVRISQGPN